ncbi:MAG: DUF2141 domain-containing protein [Alphaproteobacteria bacterium]|nr:DUF2141 domain-containing protein [Alphaproteobacteria bacterium]
MTLRRTRLAGLAVASLWPALTAQITPPSPLAAPGPAALPPSAPSLAKPACQGEPTGARLKVVVDDVRADQGIMTVTLYPEESSKFLRAKGELAVWRRPARAPSTTVCAYLPGPGRYAVVVYDDLNSNLHFDHTLFAPREPYGFANNPKLYFVLPSVHAVSFSAGPGETVIHIRLVYPANLGDPPTSGG